MGGAVCLYCTLRYIAFAPVKGYRKVFNKIRRRLRKPNLTLTRGYAPSGVVCLYCTLRHIAFAPFRIYWCDGLMLFRRNLTLTAWSAHIINFVILLLPLSKFIGRAVGYLWAVRLAYIARCVILLLPLSKFIGRAVGYLWAVRFAYIARCNILLYPFRSLSHKPLHDRAVVFYPARR